MSETAADLVASLHATGDACSALRARAADAAGSVLLPEAEDPRVLRAAIALRELGIAKATLLGGADALRESITRQGADPGAFEVVDPTTDGRRQELAARLHARRAAKGMSESEALERVSDPLQFGAGLLASGMAHALVAGATHSTSDVVRAGLHHLGMGADQSVLSGAFLLLRPEVDGQPGLSLYFADSAVVPAPTEE